MPPRARPAARPRPRPSAADELTFELIDLLKEQALEPGDRLPSVTTLASRFAVTPPRDRTTY